MNKGLIKAIIWVIGTGIAVGMLVANSMIEVRTFELIIGITFIIMGIISRTTSDARFVGLITIIVGVLNVLSGSLEMAMPDNETLVIVRYAAFGIWYLTMVCFEIKDVTAAFRYNEKLVGITGVIFLVFLILSAVFYFWWMLTLFVVFYIR